VTSGTISGRDAGDELDAPERILRAAVAELVLHGAGALAMHEVADRAGVSKGLIHYHYHDKDAVLARAAERLGERIASRGRRALAASTPGSVVGDLREWMSVELRTGEWRALVSLGDWPAPAVQRAARQALAARRAMAGEMAASMFARLRIEPSITAAQAGDLLAALVSGLAVESRGADATSSAFDVLVLALLGLAV
jgi:AcrR family transcriptional regulator